MATMKGDDELKRLEYLSLVYRVSNELDSATGMSNKVLAMFVSELGKESTTVDEFDAKVKENGAEFPDFFLRKLFTMIHDKDESNEYKGLSIVEIKEKVNELERGIDLDVLRYNKQQGEDDGIKTQRKQEEQLEHH